jgi:superfamily II DNA or RNA helicase
MITFDYDSSYRVGRLLCDESILTLIRNHFSVKDSSATFANMKLKFKGSSQRVPERKYAIQATGRFDMGLFEEIRVFLRDENLSTDVTCTETFIRALLCGFGDVDVSDTLQYPLRDYQTETVRQCLKEGRGTVVVATGGGKSLIQASLIENWKLLKGSIKCLLIVPGTSLVNQLLNDFNEYNVSFTYSGWTGDMDKQDTEVIIVNTELLCSQFGNHKNLLNVDLVLRDEVHGNKASNQITKIVSKIKTPNKFGFTGTLPKDKIDVWKIIGTFGSVIYEKNSKELRDEEYLSDVQVMVLKLNHSFKVNGYKKELMVIQRDEHRHKVIRKIVGKMNKNVLILVNRIEHGDNLSEFLQFSDKETFFVHGAVPVEVRAQIIQKMEESDNIVTVAMSSIFSTGINIKNIHYIIFAAGGKSFIRTVQSVGRGLRLHKNKNKLVIFDLYDNFKFSIEHVEERKSFYDEEQIPWKEMTVNL